MQNESVGKDKENSNELKNYQRDDLRTSSEAIALTRYPSAVGRAVEDMR